MDYRTTVMVYTKPPVGVTICVHDKDRMIEVTVEPSTIKELAQAFTMMYADLRKRYEWLEE